MSGSRWEEHAHDLRAAAELCRDDALDLVRLAATTEWAGVSGEAFRAALRLQVRELDLTARALEAAADLALAHGRGVAATLAAATAPAALAEHVVDTVDALLP